MHMAKLLSFETHEKLIALYYEEMSRDPMEGYTATSMEQVRRADKEIFMRLAQLTRAGLTDLQDNAGKKFPLDDLVTNVMMEHRITALLLPLQAKGQGQAPEKRSSSNAELDKLRAENKRLKSGATDSQGGKGSKGKGKGGKKSNNNNRQTTSMPKELIGMNPKVRGEAVCYDYNMQKGCGNKDCKRLHACCFPGCGGKHSLVNCEKRKRG